VPAGPAILIIELAGRPRAWQPIAVAGGGVATTVAVEVAPAGGAPTFR